MTVDDAITLVLSQSQVDLVGSLRAALDRPMPETVHELRVALRRLRAALALSTRWADTEALDDLKRDAHALSDSLGESRNWDILIEETLAPHIDRLAGIADVAALTEAAATARHDSYRRVRVLLDGPLPQKLLLGLALALSQQHWRGEAGVISKRLAGGIRRRATREISRADRQLRNHGKQLQNLTDEARHELRIEVKRLRYTIEWLEPIWPRSNRIRRYQKRINALQSVLGSLNDARAAQQLLNRIASDDPSPISQRAVGAIAGWTVRDKAFQLAALDKLWQEFRTAKRFW
ncbi:CHAD domain-containing protein [Kaistia terrae]|uniref:CHAD domain-containing protein n=1 Tax=Kaistia terrae TaxID=537017 RepID=A0ABW0PT93_9HYPH|nr:CHAD domain-containing protein [Kaistia terrae]MCX5577415.1 CHAD domain-containing protein [Kaistia terrae]